MKAKLTFETREADLVGRSFEPALRRQAAARPNYGGRFQMKPLLLLLCCAGLLTGPAVLAANSWIWWEGEKPASSSIPATTWLSPSSQSERDALSGGNILTAVSISTTGPYWANYTVNVAAAGTYRLYARKIWAYGPFKWRFDSAAWTYASSQLQLMDNADYKQYFPLNWVYLGEVTLAAGWHTFSVRLDVADWSNEPSNIQGADLGGFDAFILSTQPFIPRGKLQPYQKYNLAEPGKWNFESPADDFSPAALLDLRSLNENVAGQSGFVGVAADHSGKYVLGDGTPVRFWGVNVFNESSDFDSLSMQARFLAKRGINLVRFFHPLPTSNPTNINEVDPAYIDGAQRTVAAFKQAGIYTELGLFYNLAFTIRAGWGVAGYTNDVASPTVILMFDDTLKAAYKEWVRQLFTATNSYTGLTLARDPAVAVIEIQNEDSFFFWTFDPTSFPPAQRENLEAKFGAFLIAKYGSVDVAQSLWEGFTLPDDAPASGRMGMAGAYLMTDLTDAAWSGYTPRMADQIEFLTGLQRAFYQEMRDYLRNTLGCQSLIESCNWMTADTRILTDAERYTYTANDVIDKHDYFGPAAHVGDYYQSIAAVQNPRLLPPGYKKVAGFPHNISESTWVNPNRFKAEGPMLIAAYSAMADVNSFLWFGTGTLTYEDIMNEFQVSVPSLLGQFPGAALLYRRGDVAEGPVAVREERSLSGIYNKEMALISEFQAGDNPVYDPQTGTGRIDPLAMLVGKVECDYVTNSAASYVSPLLFEQMDTTNEIVHSLPVNGNTNGQLTLDWGKGLFQMNSPCSQGIAGFLSSVPQVDLNDVSIASSNAFGAILVISLDNLPIAQSQKILIQAMTEDNPYGWQERDQVFTNGGVVYSGKEIISMGQPPMNVVNVAGTVTLKGLGQGRNFAVRVLDENGYDRNPGELQAMGADLRITLPSNSLYTVYLGGLAPLPPVIVVQPESVALELGGAVTLSVGANGPMPFAYQWEFNGTVIAGATNASLTIPNCAVGSYRVEVSNAYGSILSSNAVVSLQNSVFGEFDSGTKNQYVDVTLSEGMDAASLLNAGNYSIGGYTITNVMFFTNNLGVGSTNMVILQLDKPLTNDFTLNVSTNVQSFAGAPLAASTAVAGTVDPLSSIDIGSYTTRGATYYNGPGSYEINASGNDIWNAKDGFRFVYETKTNNFAVAVQVPALFAADGWSKAGLMARQTSDPTAGTSRMVYVITTAVNQETLDGSYGVNSLSMGVRDTTGNYAYEPAGYIGDGRIVPSYPNQWLLLTRQTDGVYDLFTCYGSTDDANWTWLGSFNPVTSGAKTRFPSVVNVGMCTTAHITPPGADLATATYQNFGDYVDHVFLTSSPESVTVGAGTNATFSVLAGSDGTVLYSGAANPVPLIGYQWYTNGAAVAGASSNSYTTPLATASLDGLQVYCALTALGGATTTSAVATLTVDSPPSIISQPASLTITSGASAVFWVIAAGTAPLSCQWQFDGANLSDNATIAGSQSNLLSLASVLASEAGSYRVLVTNAYGAVTSTVATLVVRRATPVISWAPPAAIAYGTALSSSQLNATANVPGAFAYNPPAGAVLNAGTDTLSVAFTPMDTNNYQSVTDTVSVVVLKANPVVTWPAPSAITYGAALAASQLDATANVPGRFAYTPPAGAVPTAGTNTLSVIFTPTDTVDYSSATDTVSLVVSPASLTVTPSNASRAYGQTNPVFTGAIMGVTNGDNLTAAYSCSATTNSPVGTYPIVPALVDPNHRQANYTVSLTNGTLTVGQAAPIMTWTNPAPITYGASLTSNQLNSTASVPGSFAYNPTNGTVPTVGTNALSVIFTPTDTVDYSSASDTVSLVVSPASLTVTASNASRAYGQTNPVFTGLITGVINGDNLTATYSCAATSTSPPGSYPIVPALVDPNDRQTNYTVSLTNGTLTVGQAAPIMTWTNPAPITYGASLTSNQLNSTASVPGSFAYNPTNGTVLNVGANTLSVIFTPTDRVDYDSMSATVSLVVSPASLTVTASNASRAYGQTNPVFTGLITGVTNGDNLTATYSCTATSASPPGAYPIAPALVDPEHRQTNYQVMLSNGTFTVTPAAPPTVLSVTPDAGLTNGGTMVTILGTGFESGATVNFGPLPAGSVKAVNATNLTAVTPPSGLGTVDVVVTNADGQSAILTNGFTFIAPPGTAPSIVSQPANQVVGLGQTVKFAVTALGTAPLSFQWQVNGTNLTDNGRITGCQSDLLAVANVFVSDAGNYQVVVTNAYGSTPSAVATLTIVAPPVFQAATQRDGMITLTWSATAGETYQVQYKTNLSQPNWTELVVVTATNSTATASDALNASTQRFYRTVWVP